MLEQVKIKGIRTTWMSCVNTTLVMRAFLSGILGIAGLTKLGDTESLQVYVYVLDWLPVSLTLFVVDVLPWAELGIAVAVWIKAVQKQAQWIMTGFYFFFFALAVYGNVMGWTIDCSCFGVKLYYLIKHYLN